MKLPGIFRRIFPRRKWAKWRRYVARKRRSKRSLLVNLTRIATVGFACLLGIFFLGAGVFAFYSKDLPSPDQLTQRERILSTRILDRKGKLLYEIHGEEDRTLVKLEDLPDHLIWATLAAEDSEFYRHRGFDIPGILRSLYNVVVRQNIQGGSTITQQVVRNTFPEITRKRTLRRKIRELILSLQIEARYSKDQILQMYLNEVSYGGQAYGVEAAVNLYFGKSARDLTLSQSAFLAGLPQAPTRYSPFGAHPEKAEARRRYVIHLMETRGWMGKDRKWQYLSEEAADKARKKKLQYADRRRTIQAPHFVMYVKSLLEEKYGTKVVEQGGLRVKTTLDLSLQEALQKMVKEEVEKIKYLQVGNGALVALDPKTGQILAMVGSKNFFGESSPQGCVPGKTCRFDPQVNATLSLRQPGSAIKPVTYATAFKQSYTPATVLMDVSTCFPNEPKPYCPQNYDGSFRGPTPLRKALGNSINLLAVKLLRLVGLSNMLETARDLGITTFNQPERYGLSLTLGGGEVTLLELTNAYATFANQGEHHDPGAILEVKDPQGKILEKLKPTQGEEAVSDEVAYLISDVLSDNSARTRTFGSRSYLYMAGYDVAVKTGTTDDYRDAWTVGYTPSIAIGVWAGNNDNAPMRGVPGVRGAGPIWNKAMWHYLEGKKNEPFPQPPGVVSAQVDKLSGKLPAFGQPQRWEKFIQGTVPREKSDFYEELEICKPDGLLASDACRAAGKTKKEVFVTLKAAVPQWQDEVNAWVKGAHKDHPRYNPPTEVSRLYFHPEGKEEPVVKITSPEKEVELSFTVKAEVLSPYDVTKVEIFLDNAPIAELTSIPWEKKVTLGEGMEGEHEIMVRAEDSGGNVGNVKKKIIVAGPTPTSTPTPTPSEEGEE